LPFLFSLRTAVPPHKRFVLPFRETVLELIENRDWESLKQKDQLLNEKAKGNCFWGFEEGDLNFRPTYRFLLLAYLEKWWADLIRS